MKTLRLDIREDGYIKARILGARKSMWLEQGTFVEAKRDEFRRDWYISNFEGNGPDLEKLSAALIAVCNEGAMFDCLRDWAINKK